MQMAMDAADCTPAFADLLRRAMGSKRSHERMAALRDDLYAGMARNGIVGEAADEIYEKLAAFANFGFAESHSISFAYLVYASAFFKRYYPAAFCAALLDAQPMGFYSPQTLVADARRHGVVVRGPDLNASAAGPTLEPEDPAGEPPVASVAADWSDLTVATGFAVRLGLASIRSIGTDVAERIAAGRPYRDMADLARRTELTAGAAGVAGDVGGVRLLRADPPGGAVGGRCGGPGPARPAVRAGGRRRRSPLPLPTEVETAMADVWATGVSPDSYPTQFVRDQLVRGRRAHRPRSVHCGRRVAGAGRRRGHPPAAAGDRQRDHLPQPGGRDGTGQRDLFEGRVGAAPAGGAGVRGAGDPRHAGARRRRHQRRRRAHRQAGAVGEVHLPGLPVNPASRHLPGLGLRGHAAHHPPAPDPAGRTSSPPEPRRTRTRWCRGRRRNQTGPATGPGRATGPVRATGPDRAAEPGCAPEPGRVAGPGGRAAARPAGPTRRRGRRGCDGRVLAGHRSAR